MKKITFTFFLIFTFFSNNLSAKEIRSMFGFYLNLPKNYEAIQNLNLNKLIEENPNIEINRDLINEIMIGTSKGDMDIEYFFPVKYNFELNNIYITQPEGNVKEYMLIEFKDLCLAFKNLFEGLWKKQEIKQHKCTKNPKEIKIKSPVSIYLIHDGPYRNTKLYNYIFEVEKGYSTTVSLLCENQNCNKLKKDLVKITNSITK
mgnify:CR=1 FL=1